jgi:hypothetical protein
VEEIDNDSSIANGQNDYLIGSGTLNTTDTRCDDIEQTPIDSESNHTQDIIIDESLKQKNASQVTDNSSLHIVRTNPRSRRQRPPLSPAVGLEEVDYNHMSSRCTEVINVLQRISSSSLPQNFAGVLYGALEMLKSQSILNAFEGQRLENLKISCSS